MRKPDPHARQRDRTQEDAREEMSNDLAEEAADLSLRLLKLARRLSGDGPPRAGKAA